MTEKYDFDRYVERRGTDCMKHDEMPDGDTIPLWVADMDFETAPVVVEALMRRMEHGCFGYTKVSESYYQATIDWFARRHGWQGIERDWFIYTSGVVPAVSAIIKAMTVPGDKVLVQTPVYNCFFSSIRNNGCVLKDAPLRAVEVECKGGNGEKGWSFEIDFAAFEAACADDGVKVFVLCNPHNPVGRVWTADELRRMGDICQRHGVFVIADEIHCEFVFDKGQRIVNAESLSAEQNIAYHPFMSVSDAPCAVCVSPSKAFNIAGLQIANIIVKDQGVRQRIDRAININEVCDVNPFGVIALQAAYSKEGEEWLAALNEYIYANYQFVKTFISERLPQWKVSVLEGTYLLWVDVGGMSMTGAEVADVLMEKAKVCVNAGDHYGDEAGRNYIRINLATQRSRLKEAMERISCCLIDDCQ